MKNWMWKYSSNKAVHGNAFAASQAARQGVPISIVLAALRHKII